MSQIKTLINRHLASVSHETVESLLAYKQLVLKWQGSINLISPTTIADFDNRHLADSLQLLPQLKGCKHVVDMGSGAGLPAIPLGICLEDTRFTLIESDRRKSIFLKQAVRELGLGGRFHIINQRIEALKEIPNALPIDCIIARAAAPLAKLLEWSAHLYRLPLSAAANHPEAPANPTKTNWRNGDIPPGQGLNMDNRAEKGQKLGNNDGNNKDRRQTSLVKNLHSAGKRLVFPKGIQFQAELTEALSLWYIDYEIIPSDGLTAHGSDGGVILLIKDFEYGRHNPAKNST